MLEFPCRCRKIHGVVQRRAVAVRRGLQLLQKYPNNEMIRVNLGQLVQLLRIAAMVGRGVMRLGNPNFRISARASRGQLDVITRVTSPWKRALAGRTSASRGRQTLSARPWAGRDRAWNPPYYSRPSECGLHFADRIKVLVDLVAVVLAKLSLERSRLRSVDRATLCDAGPRCPVGGCHFAEQALKNDARMRPTAAASSAMTRTNCCRCRRSRCRPPTGCTNPSARAGQRRILSDLLSRDRSTVVPE